MQRRSNCRARNAEGPHEAVPSGAREVRGGAVWPAERSAEHKSRKSLRHLPPRISNAEPGRSQLACTARNLSLNKVLQAQVPNPVE